MKVNVRLALKYSESIIILVFKKNITASLTSPILCKLKFKK